MAAICVSDIKFSMKTLQVIIPPEGPDVGKEAKECVLNDSDCPLAILLQHPPSKGKCCAIELCFW